MVRGYRGTAGYYVQSLTGGSGAAWNAKARFPAASTLKLAIAATVLAEHSGIPPPGSYVDGLLRELIVPSDDAAANSLLVWLDGSTSAGAYRVNGLMRSIGLTDSLMYGGYQITRALSASIPRRVDEAPSFGVGKYTTAWDMTSLWRALWLASGGVGPLRSSPARAHARRCPLSPLAHRTRARPAEARHVRRSRPQGGRAAQGRLDLDRAPRHRARLLGGRSLRCRSHDVPAVGRLDVVGPARRSRRGRIAGAVSARSRAEHDEASPLRCLPASPSTQPWPRSVQFLNHL